MCACTERQRLGKRERERERRTFFFVSFFSPFTFLSFFSVFSLEVLILKKKESKSKKESKLDLFFFFSWRSSLAPCFSSVTSSTPSIYKSVIREEEEEEERAFFSSPFIQTYRILSFLLCTFLFFPLLSRRKATAIERAKEREKRERKDSSLHQTKSKTLFLLHQPKGRVTRTHTIRRIKRKRRRKSFIFS